MFSSIAHFPEKERVRLVIGIAVMGFVIFLLATSPSENMRSYFAQKDPMHFLQECGELPYRLENYEASKRYQCYLENTAKATRDMKIGEVISAFQRYFETEEGQKMKGPTLHTVGHIVGEVTVSTGQSNKAILEECGTFATGGCLNGAGHYNVLITQGVERAEEFCKTEGISKAVREDCYHGIGHGISELTRFNIKEGIQLCNRLENTGEGRFECGHAVLMEWDLIMNEDAPLPGDIVAFCAGLDEVYRDTCYEFAPTFKYAKTQNSSATFALCERVPKHIRSQCLGGAVEVLFHTTPRSKQDELITSVCNLSSRERVRTCYFEAVNAAIFSIGQTAGKAAIPICKKAPEWLKKDCYMTIPQRLVSEYDESSKNRFCEDVMPEEHKQGCYEPYASQYGISTQ